MIPEKKLVHSSTAKTNNEMILAHGSRRRDMNVMFTCPSTLPLPQQTSNGTQKIQINLANIIGYSLCLPFLSLTKLGKGLAGFRRMQRFVIWLAVLLCLFRYSLHIETSVHP
jgi:hypothetical protein